ncbi:hypothetical protein, partial [Siccirubricoccus deserti]|uniref:hypothetical protein n=1 Tax=Siccirubricoccus deserti TaxID=2013562 RepID=UPI001C9500BA
VLDRHLHPVSPERSGYRAIMRPRNQPKGRSAEAHRAGGTTVTVKHEWALVCTAHNLTKLARAAAA